mmetsp:Transcript_54337/g.99898  ORF Transcript_54337/g.99898 Transcript_54337/m.99898 type:complete len:369 (+) Transcript_54337:103-1209(+)
MSVIDRNLPCMDHQARAVVGMPRQLQTAVGMPQQTQPDIATQQTQSRRSRHSRRSRADAVPTMPLTSTAPEMGLGKAALPMVHAAPRRPQLQAPSVMPLVQMASATAPPNILRFSSALSPQSPATSAQLTRAAPLIFAVRHAQSVANAIKASDESNYFKRWMLDDGGNPREIRLRDAMLSPKGISDALAAAASLDKDAIEGGAVLLVVSPMLRTILTACLLFHQLIEWGVPLKVVLEPAVREVVYAPHDIIENVGRPLSDTIREAEEILITAKAPPAAISLLHRLSQAASALPPHWWIPPTAPDNLPQLVLYSEAAARRANIEERLRAHLAGVGQCSKVYIVCHWGTIWTLTGGKSCQNLEFQRLEHL